MSLSGSTAAARIGAAVKQFAWSHPEWSCVGASVGAWAVMLSHGVTHWGHAHHHRMTFAEEIAHFALMVTAMMLPLLLGSIRIAAFRSFPFRRHRAMGVFLVGYFGPWIALAVPVALLRRLPWTHTHWIAALAFAFAAVWPLTPTHARARSACHRTVPLGCVGWRADLACLGFGARIGAACVTTCWALMVACSLTGHAILAMVGGAALTAAEKLSFRPSARRIATETLCLAGAYCVLALSNG